jgi:hypothetical protein
MIHVIIPHLYTLQVTYENKTIPHCPKFQRKIVQTDRENTYYKEIREEENPEER